MSRMSVYCGAMSMGIFRNLVSVALFAVCFASHGADWVSKETGVSFRLPSDPDWGQITNSHVEAKLTLARKDNEAAVIVIAFDRKPNETLTEEFVKRWEKGFYKKGGSVKISGEFLTFKGKPAYKLIDTQTKEEDLNARRVVILWFDGDKILEIAATKWNADPFEDSVIKEFVNSMKFLPKSANDADNGKGPASSSRSPETNRKSAADGSPKSR